MTTAYTSLLGLALPVTGELSGTWGDTVNNAITSLVDSAVAGTTTLSTDGDVTLTTTTGAANQSRQAILLCTGARTAQRTITAPAQSKVYVVINDTTGGFAVKIVGAGPTTGVTVAAGRAAIIAWDGSDFQSVTSTSVADIQGLGTGVATALGTNVGSAGAFVVNGGVLGTPSSGTLTNATGLPISTGVSGLGTGVATALAVNVGTAGAPVVNGGALGTPSSGTATNLTGLPISTGVSGLGTGVATALAVNTGTAGALVVNGGALGTPSSGTLTNATGLPISTGVSGLGTGVATALGIQANTTGGIVTAGGAPRVVNIPDATSITMNADTTDLAYQVNSQAFGATLTINAPTGTPVDGQKIILRINSANQQNFSWNAVFGGSVDSPLPTTTTGGFFIDYMGFIYNGIQSKWQMVAKNFGF